ncbi:MAG: hypothetical protein ACQEXQ_23930 [Bacillota bacterium]
MRVNLEVLLFYGAPGIAFISVILFAVIRFRKTNSFLRSFLQSIGLAILLYGTAFLWWFINLNGDGLAQLVSMMCYGIGFIVTCVVNTGVLYFLKKKVIHYG